MGKVIIVRNEHPKWSVKVRVECLKRGEDAAIFSFHNSPHGCAQNRRIFGYGFYAIQKQKIEYFGVHLRTVA